MGQQGSTYALLWVFWNQNDANELSYLNNLFLDFH